MGMKVRFLVVIAGVAAVVSNVIIDGNFVDGIINIIIIFCGIIITVVGHSCYIVCGSVIIDMKKDDNFLLIFGRQ